MTDAPPRKKQNRQAAKEPPKKPRTEHDTLQNQFSKRIQDWRIANGTFSKGSTGDDKGNGAKIYDKMINLSVAQIFHVRVAASVQNDCIR